MKFKLHIVKLSSVVLFTTLLTACASYDTQLGSDFKSNMVSNENNSDLLHEIILVGDAGNANEPNGKKVLDAVEKYITQQNSKQTLLFMGDNIYPLGMPKVGNKDRSIAED